MQITRTLSLTGRKKIPRNKISIHLVENADGEMGFDAKLDFDGLNVSPTGRVIIQPYYKTSRMRFDCGTVESCALPDDTMLTDIDLGGSVQFRVLIVNENDEPGKILASAEQVPLKDPGGEEDKESLIEIREKDIGDVVWRLELEDGLEKPELVINDRIPGATALIEDHTLFQGLLFPSVIRLIMSSIFTNQQQHEGEDEEDTWQSNWIKFAEGLTDEEIPKNHNDDENDRWIEAIVSEFSRKHKPCRKIIAHLGASADE